MSYTYAPAYSESYLPSVSKMAIGNTNGDAYDDLNVMLADAQGDVHIFTFYGGADGKLDSHLGRYENTSWEL
jgi:hypothetical protein